MVWDAREKCLLGIGDEKTMRWYGRENGMLESSEVPIGNAISRVSRKSDVG